MKNIGPSLPIVGSNPLVERGLKPSNGSVGGADFKKELEALANEKINKAGGLTSSPLKFSNHAIERMQTRGVQFSGEQMNKIENAVQKAAAKGARETLLLTDNAALIVSIKDKTVVTVMDKSALRENVFTNIDSTVVI